MLTAITYNCDPDSLADISQESFVDALENEFAARADLRECNLTVTFQSGYSRVASVTVTDGSDDPADYDDRINELAGRAFNACCMPS